MRVGEIDMKDWYSDDKARVEIEGTVRIRCSLELSN